MILRRDNVRVQLYISGVSHSYYASCVLVLFTNSCIVFDVGPKYIYNIVSIMTMCVVIWNNVPVNKYTGT